MSQWKKLLSGAIAVFFVAGLAAFVFRAQIATAILQQAAHKNAGRDIVPTLPDGLHVALCGTGSPFPDPSRAGPCTAIIAGSRLFIVDTGEGSARSLAWMGIPAARIEAIFLTHFHSDHIDGLGPFLLQRWGLGTARAPLAIRGPTGVDRVVAGFRDAYALDAGYRVAHHSDRIMPPAGSGGTAMPFALPEPRLGDQTVVLEDGGLKVTAFRVNHSPIDPAVGYRFDYKGRSVVISGDTVKAPSLVAAAKGADLLVHEALQPGLVGLIGKEFAERRIDNVAQIMRDILNYHTTPEEAAQQASAAGVRHLVLNHIVPPIPAGFMNPAFLGDASKNFSGPITVGEDGMLFSLPAGGTEIFQARLAR